ncbi:Hypp4403 [Branchiostoma lanceolatum]|uniref:Hypp4403 protein n=1 Tax=Branchiostoma lanceolatum TaxID=7740 RepID=A0A8K0A7H2_BRALA|nr:Hypp4403 [Branchiostoma lanceolatum]
MPHLSLNKTSGAVLFLSTRRTTSLCSRSEFSSSGFSQVEMSRFNMLKKRLEKMQNCYGNKAGRPSQGEQDEQNERLTGRHIETLAFLQEIAKENKELKAKVETLELATHTWIQVQDCLGVTHYTSELVLTSAELAKCASLHQQARESQERVKRVQQECLERADKARGEMVERQKKEGVQQECLERADKAQGEMVERQKKEVMHLIEEKLTVEQEYQDKVKLLQQQVEQLQRENAQLQSQLSTYQQEDSSKATIHQQLNETLGRVDELRLDNSRLREENNNLLLELQAYREFQGKNEILSEELREVNQKNRELKFRIAKLEKEVVTSEQDLEEAETAHMSNARLQKRVQSLEEEVILRKAHQDEQERTISDLSEQYDKNKALFDALAQEKEEMANLITQLRDQLRKAEQQSSAQQAGFKEFVALKREFNTLKQEYEVLAMREKMRQVSLPSLKEPSPKLRALTAKSSQSEPALVKIDTGKRHKKHKALTHLSSFTEGGQR